jgi:hypothetical protein
VRSFITVHFTKYYQGDQIKENEMDEACGTHGNMGNTTFWSGNLRGRDHFEDLDVDGRIILERILGKQHGNVCTGFIRIRIGTVDGLLSW